MEDLPDEVLLHLFQFLHWRKLGLTTPLVCRRWYLLSNHNTVWKQNFQYIHKKYIQAKNNRDNVNNNDNDNNNNNNININHVNNDEHENNNQYQHTTDNETETLPEVTYEDYDWKLAFRCMYIFKDTQYHPSWPSFIKARLSKVKKTGDTALMSITGVILMIFSIILTIYLMFGQVIPLFISIPLISVAIVSLIFSPFIWRKFYPTPKHDDQLKEFPSHPTLFWRYSTLISALNILSAILILIGFEVLYLAFQTNESNNNNNNSNNNNKFQNIIINYYGQKITQDDKLSYNIMSIDNIYNSTDSNTENETIGDLTGIGGFLLILGIFAGCAGLTLSALRIKEPEISQLWQNLESPKVVGVVLHPLCRMGLPICVAAGCMAIFFIFNNSSLASNAFNQYGVGLPVFLASLSLMVMGMLNLISTIYQKYRKHQSQHEIDEESTDRFSKLSSYWAKLSNDEENGDLLELGTYDWPTSLLIPTSADNNSALSCFGCFTSILLLRTIDRIRLVFICIIEICISITGVIGTLCSAHSGTEVSFGAMYISLTITQFFGIIATILYLIEWTLVQARLGKELIRIQELKSYSLF